MPDILKNLSLALGYTTLGEFAKDWKELSTDEKEQLKKDYELYRTTTPEPAAA